MLLVIYKQQSNKSMGNKTTKIQKTNRPQEYIPQQGQKATLSLADFSDENLFAELRRRGYNGELRYSKIINV